MRTEGGRADRRLQDAPRWTCCVVTLQLIPQSVSTSFRSQPARFWPVYESTMSRTQSEAIDADTKDALRRSNKKWAHGVTGSVLEFAFGSEPRSYLVTSYPYPTHEANREDKREFRRYVLLRHEGGVLFLMIENSQHPPPGLEHFLSTVKFRHIQNISVNRDGHWFLYYTGMEYRRGNRTNFGKDTEEMQNHAWTTDMNRLRSLHDWGGISYLSFGTTEKSYFMRLTENDQNEWHLNWGFEVPEACQSLLKLRYSQVRACTFGSNGSWIIYGRTWHAWGGPIPPKLDKALQIGKRNRWVINVRSPASKDDPTHILTMHAESCPKSYQSRRVCSSVRQWPSLLRFSREL